MGDTDILCVHHEFKAENKILTIICKVQNSLELVSWRIFLFFFFYFYMILRPMKSLLLFSSSSKRDGSRKMGRVGG